MSAISDLERDGRLAITQWQEDLQRLEVREAVILTEISTLRNRIANMEAAIRDYRELHGLPVQPKEDASLSKELRGLTVKEMILKVVEREETPEFMALHISRKLVQGGMFDNVGYASDAVYSTIRRYKEQFEKVARGRYRIKGTGGTQPRMALPRATEKNKGKLSLEVGRIMSEYPHWERSQVLKYLQQNGWDFEGKKPILAVSMAVARLARKPQLRSVS